MQARLKHFRQRIAQGVLVGDGATGTLLQARGLAAGDCPEEWNLSHPEAVRDVAASYVAVGAEVVTTNSIGGSPRKLAHYGLADKCELINERAGVLAREAVGDHAFVVGSIGPPGELLEPYGTLTREEAVGGFERQIAGLVAGGVDGVLAETISDLREALLILEAALRVAPDLPRFCTMTFQPEGRTSFGVSVERAVEALEKAGADGIGANCGIGGEQLMPIVAQFTKLASVPVIAVPNAGVPELVAGRTVFRDTPEDMARYAVGFVEAGVRWVGGCCGTTPEHIRAIANAVRCHRAP